MVLSANLGFPRVGAKRELKKALESFWKSETSKEQLEAEAAKGRKTNWQVQKSAGVDLIPSNDFSYYDQVLDTSALVGAVPERFKWNGGSVDLKTYFAMARGSDAAVAMDMTKWFDTNYHYLVPEFVSSQKFTLSSSKPFDEFSEAKALGILTKPVLLGPVSYLQLGKMKGGNTLSLLDNLLPIYEQALSKLAALGAEWIQLDEPCLVLDQSDEAKAAYKKAYDKLSKAAGSAKIFLATYFDALGDNLETAVSLPVGAIHVDLVRAPAQLDEILKKIPTSTKLSLGLINGRNIWKANLDAALKTAREAVSRLGEDRVIIAPSCSLLHTPVDLGLETKLDPEIKSWMAFSVQKIREIATIATALRDGEGAVESELAENRKAAATRKTSGRIHNAKVKERVAAVTEAMLKRNNPFPKRIALQQQHLRLPLLPTTTIGSFPQTAEVRATRADFKAGRINEKQYDEFLKKETEACVRYQEEIGIDVLVHGEFERNDMVEYFGEQLGGYTFTSNGWVQSYGSRCVKPPVIFGDIYRDKPMTVHWSKFAQSLTKKTMKGMLTGPVTILQWSFVRDDQPRSETCKQIALAIRDEVMDLEKAGIKAIQIDEPAIREGLPLHHKHWADYLRWAVDAFRLSSAGVSDETQIHTHMCYSEFNDIIKSVAEMDADVISIETSRSQMELLDAFVNFKYPNQIGPGVYDIHSPRIPSEEEMTVLLRKALDVLAPDQVWVNPDCGLKTRGWKETKPALEKMVVSARKIREELQKGKKAANA